MSGKAKDCKGPGATHHYACYCRENFFAEDSKRMIRAFQDIQKETRNINNLRGDSLAIIYAICREAIAPRKDNHGR